MNIDWSQGPVASLLGRSDPNAGPSAGRGFAQGARYGSFGGPAGALAGGLVGGIVGWLQSRNWSNQLADMANNRQQPDYGGGINWDANLGDPQSAGVRSGPPSDLAGGGTLAQLQEDGDGTPPWYDDATMNSDDPLGLVPDYGRDGTMDENQDGHVTPGERRDYRDAYGRSNGGFFADTPFNGTVTDLMVGGSPVILGSGDPNGRYRNRGTDYG